MNVFKTERCQFLIENLNLERATGVEGARWEHFQIAHLNNDSVFAVENKSRQIAFSWTVAAEAVAEAQLYGIGTTFVSINLEEAKEKIRYARQIFESIELAGLAPLRTDNQLEIEFANGARLISHPSKPPRGKTRMNVVLDEFAHVQRDRQIYTGSMPVITKGGRMRIGSSPMGASGLFWEIYSEAIQRYPGYTRKRTPWWEVQYFCTNVREARRLAPALPTAERVEMFGTDRIKAIFANLPVEDFRQEYEAEFVDEVTAWITWDEIRASQQQPYDPAENPGGFRCEIAQMTGAEPDAAFEAVRRVAEWIREGKVEGVLAGGYDVGRTRNTSELFLVGLSTTQSYPLRLGLTLDNVPFETQEAVIAFAMRTLPVLGLLIDRNGIGMQLAENLSREFPGKVRGVDFTMQHKKLWATDAKMLIQKHKTPLPVDRDVAYQIHSVKRLVTPSRNLIFDTDRNQRHHADKFWAWALALAASLIEWVDEQTPPDNYGYSIFGN